MSQCMIWDMSIRLKSSLKSRMFADSTELKSKIRKAGILHKLMRSITQRSHRRSGSSLLLSLMLSKMVSANSLWKEDLHQVQTNHQATKIKSIRLSNKWFKKMRQYLLSMKRSPYLSMLQRSSNTSEKWTTSQRTRSSIHCQRRETEIWLSKQEKVKVRVDRSSSSHTTEGSSSKLCTTLSLRFSWTHFLITFSMFKRTLTASWQEFMECSR